MCVGSSLALMNSLLVDTTLGFSGAGHETLNTDSAALSLIVGWEPGDGQSSYSWHSYLVCTAPDGSGLMPTFLRGGHIEFVTPASTPAQFAAPG